MFDVLLKFTLIAFLGVDSKRLMHDAKGRIQMGVANPICDDGTVSRTSFFLLCKTNLGNSFMCVIFDWLVINANFSNISAISRREQIVLLTYRNVIL